MDPFEPTPVLSASSGGGGNSNMNGIMNGNMNGGMNMNGSGSGNNGSGGQIRGPGENDVVVGIGCNKHCGNVKFRQFIKAYKRARFRTNPKIETVEAVKEVVSFWRNLSPRGRFLAQSRSGGGTWHEVEEKQAMRIASFFLLNQNSETLKRQKSTDAIKEARAQAQAEFQRQSSTCTSMSEGQGQGRRHSQSDMQSMMAALEPVPIGSLGSSSSPMSRSMSAGVNLKGPDMCQSQGQMNMKSLPDLDQLQSNSKASSGLDDSDPFDFNPLPFDQDPFDPLPTDFGMNSGNGNGSFNSKNGQFSGGVSSDPQVQVSVNMVVNAMPQGSQRGENSVNTVTNIQIGTLNDERKQPSNMNNMMMNNHMNKSNGSPNGFIQISTQSNGNGMDELALGNMNGIGGVGAGNNPRNDFAMNGMMQQGNNNPNSFNNNTMGMPANMMQMQNMMQSMNKSMMNMNMNIQGNSRRGSANGNMNPVMNNMNMMPNMNAAAAAAMMNQNMNNMNGNNMNFGMNGNNNHTMKNNMSNDSDQANGGGNDRPGGLRWNKNKVANSVPDAASLVGSVFDDW